MIKHNYSLRKYNTFGIDVRTKRFISPESVEKTKNLLTSNELDNENCLILGGGSNILFTTDFNGTIIHPLFNKLSVKETGPDGIIISAEAGLEWDRLVEWTVKNDLVGLENLSFIPGSVGASPIQNIGAYGVEISNLITGVHAFSLETGEHRFFSNEECMFGYRDSIFKNELKGKYLITSIELRLRKYSGMLNLSYGKLEQRVATKGEITLKTVRETIIDIRKEKLPDPSVTGNAGSFYKNPVIDFHKYSELKNEHRDIPYWKTGDNKYKIPAAWLIEKSGWKGRKTGRAGVHEKHALILVNLGNATGNDILELSNLITQSVNDMFGITLTKEVNVI